MLVLDLNTEFGMLAHQPLDLSLATLLDEMARHQIALACTASLRGVYHDHTEGNTETLQACAETRSLLPAATLNPHRYFGWEAEIERCLQAGVRLFRFYPEQQFSWTADGFAFADILKKLAGSGAIVMVSGKKPGLATAFTRATADHGLPLVLADSYWANLAETLAAMRRFDHVYLESSWLVTPNALSLIAAEVGADRVLFGSQAPRLSRQRALNLVLSADLSEREKAAILAGNAIRLLGLAPGVLDNGPRLLSAEARRLPGPVIDVHCHLGPWQYAMPDGGASGLLKQMQRAGVDRAIVSSAPGLKHDLVEGNRRLAEAIAGHPELLGYVAVNPNYFEDSVRDLDRYYQQPNFVGAKLHHALAQQTTGSPEGQALLREVARRGKPLKIHVEEHDRTGALQNLRQLANEFPAWSIIKAHGGDGRLARIVADAPNIYFEFAGSGGSSAAIRQAIEVLGPERVLFGSDADLIDMSGVIGVYADAKLSAEETRVILHANAERVFRL